ncbi:S-4TM family putative pore-forming effector [Salmonella enterica]
MYQHRASAPWVFDWVYRRMRSRNEQEAHHAAEELVKEVQSTLKAGGVA